MLEWVENQIFSFGKIKNFPNPLIISPPTNVQPDFLPWSSKINFSLKFPQWRSKLQNIYRCFSLAPNLFNHGYVTILHSTRKRLYVHHPPPSQCLRITSGWHHLRLTSSLRGTSLLWFSSVPSNYCLQSNLTFKPECVCHSLVKSSCVAPTNRIKSKVQTLPLAPAPLYFPPQQYWAAISPPISRCLLFPSCFCPICSPPSSTVCLPLD